MRFSSYAKRSLVWLNRCLRANTYLEPKHVAECLGIPCCPRVCGHRFWLLPGGGGFMSDTLGYAAVACGAVLAGLSVLLAMFGWARVRETTTQTSISDTSDLRQRQGQYLSRSGAVATSSAIAVSGHISSISVPVVRDGALVRISTIDVDSEFLEIVRNINRIGGISTDRQQVVSLSGERLGRILNLVYEELRAKDRLGQSLDAQIIQSPWCR